MAMVNIARHLSGQLNRLFCARPKLGHSWDGELEGSRTSDTPRAGTAAI